jgi:RNA ligase
MIYLANILDIQKLKEHITNGVVRQQVHPLYPELSILNYTEKAQFDRIWDNVTNVCRGLIVNTGCTKAGEALSLYHMDVSVIARPFSKFHNLNTDYVPETMEENLAQYEIEDITEKLDGSLGIIFHYDNQWHVATRGSFDSEQAQWATAYLRNHFQDKKYLPIVHYTPVCEIIAAFNRIVVSYDYEGLVLLGFIDPLTGQKMPRTLAEQAAREMELPFVRKFKKTLSEAAAENTPNFEGYVITYSHGVMVKVKFEEYIRLHRILTGLSPIAVWEMKKNKQNEEIQKLLDDPTIPEGFKKWLESWNRKLVMDGLTIQAAASHLFAQAQANNLIRKPTLGYTREERKALAIWILEATKDIPYLKGFLFTMADGKSIDEMIWDQVRPNGKHADPFKKDGE